MNFSSIVTAPSRRLRDTLRVLTLHVTPVESLLFASDIAAVGSFRCPASHPLFRDSGPIGNPLFVFPRTVVEIRHDGARSFVSAIIMRCMTVCARRRSGASGSSQ